MKPSDRAVQYVTITRKLSVMRDDLEALRNAECDGDAPGGVHTQVRLCDALHILGQIEADYRAIAFGHLSRAGKQPPLF